VHSPTSVVQGRVVHGISTAHVLRRWQSLVDVLRSPVGSTFNTSFEGRFP
jgi:hypothetical protein